MQIARIYMKLLPDVCLGSRHNPLHFGDDPDYDPNPDYDPDRDLDPA